VAAVATRRQEEVATPKEPKKLGPTAAEAPRIMLHNISMTMSVSPECVRECECTSTSTCYVEALVGAAAN